MTDTERKVIGILVGAGETTDAWKDPIHAVDHAMGWSTPATIAFVRDMMERNLVQPVPEVVKGRKFEGRWKWKEGTVLSIEKSRFA